MPVLIGATWVHAGNGWLFTSPKGGWEFPAFWTVALIVQALLGDGALAFRFAESDADAASRLTHDVSQSDRKEIS